MLVLEFKITTLEEVLELNLLPRKEQALSSLLRSLKMISQKMERNIMILKFLTQRKKSLNTQIKMKVKFKHLVKRLKRMFNKTQLLTLKTL